MTTVVDEAVAELIRTQKQTIARQKNRIEALENVLTDIRTLLLAVHVASPLLDGDVAGYLERQRLLNARAKAISGYQMVADFKIDQEAA